MIEIARNLGYALEIGPLRVEDLWTADEAFFTGTAVEVAPIAEVDGVPIGLGGRGPVTERIQKVFLAATAGLEPKYQSWLHTVVKTDSRRLT